MRRFVDRASWWLLGVVAALTIASVAAQEAQRTERGLTVGRGNVDISTGDLVVRATDSEAIFSGGIAALNEIVIDGRTNQADSTATGITYTAAQVLSGLVTRSGMTQSIVHDAMPTATNLVGALPASARSPNTALWFVVDNQDANTILTLDSASTGVTYAGGCATALGTTGAMPVLVNITAVSPAAVRVVCLQSRDDL